MMAAPSSYNSRSTESPLASLVRRTSSRRVQSPGNVQEDEVDYRRTSEEENEEAYASSSYFEEFHNETYSSNSAYNYSTPARKQLHVDTQQRSLSNDHLHSPLLHSHFARDSVATTSSFDHDDQGRLPMRRDDDGRSDYRYPYFADDASSVYSSGGPALRDSWRSTETGSTVRRPDGVPMLVVSSAEQSWEGGGRAPIVKPVTANFSRPVREHVAVGESVTPQLPADMREQKRAVLERNASRTQTPTLSTNYARSPLGRDAAVQPASSVYSSYSYYQYESAAPSPTANSFRPEPAKSKTSLTKAVESGPMTPQDYLQLGIQHHEANRLQESVRCFERSAKEAGGCGVGMLMYGLALRHGWGCAKNEPLGFKWVQKAAESAVDDLEKLRTGKRDADAGVVQTELVLAIYEVGQCFFHGWGVGKDQKMGVSYYGVAARLGDGDAQGDLAFCLANGKGCKKDKKEAARWYRAAVKQGLSEVGLAWIYKEKYQ